MRGIDGEQVLMRIFLEESTVADHRPLYRTVIELLRAEGMAGATVLKGIAGFGHGRRVHTASIEALSDRLPLIIEVVDTPAHVERILPRIEALMAGGTIMLERARVIRYAKTPSTGSPGPLPVNGP